MIARLNLQLKRDIFFCQQFGHGLTFGEVGVFGADIEKDAERFAGLFRGVGEPMEFGVVKGRAGNRKQPDIPEAVGIAEGDIGGPKRAAGDPAGRAAVALSPGEYRRIGDEENSFIFRRSVGRRFGVDRDSGRST